MRYAQVLYVKYIVGGGTVSAKRGLPPAAVVVCGREAQDGSELMVRVLRMFPEAAAVCEVEQEEQEQEQEAAAAVSATPQALSGGSHGGGGGGGCCKGNTRNKSKKGKGKKGKGKKEVAHVHPHGMVAGWVDNWGNHGGSMRAWACLDEAQVCTGRRSP